MIWPLTIICGLAGLALAHIPGALLGMLIGSIMDRNLAIKSWAELLERWPWKPKLKPKQNPQQVLFMLLGYVAKSPGRVTPEHIQAARLEMQRLHLNHAEQQAAIAAFNRGKASQLKELRKGLRKHYRAAVEFEYLLSAGWRMAHAPGMATAKQRRALQQCATWLGCTTEHFMRIEAQSMGGKLRAHVVRSELDEALRVLGVSRAAYFAQVKQAYRRQISQYHPDKLMGSGASAEQVQAATEKTRALHNAYALTRKHWKK